MSEALDMNQRSGGQRGGGSTALGLSLLETNLMKKTRFVSVLLTFFGVACSSLAYAAPIDILW
jgi:hypothetical protein